MQHALKIFSVLTSIAMLFVLLGGALVTKTGSGAGCGDSWPLCHGELIPSNITFELVIELSHRLVSGGAAIMVTVLAIWSWRTIGHVKETKPLALLAVFFLFLQALIGAAAVMWGQSDVVLALHFGISLISFAAVLLLTLLIFEVDRKFRADKIFIDRKMRKHIFSVTIYTYLVVYTGALVRHKAASLACMGWPLCGSGDAPLLPQNSGQWIHLGHRAAAGILVIWIAVMAWYAYRRYRDVKVIYYGWLLSLALILMQATSGAFIVFSKLNLGIALIHALIISCLFGVLSYLVMLAVRSRKSEKKKIQEHPSHKKWA
ncbi:COX15/CtaA family protein [Bacillus marinisedimentorum]|uniref:COX15/CtaA family protein n=1 Tax=Bacillus marinisedimentorum TaxID=1821260 RepID=UPI0007E22B8C|nr:heme A synthase [Bacillus marinisedimentorum]